MVIVHVAIAVGFLKIDLGQETVRVVVMGVCL